MSLILFLEFSDGSPSVTRTYQGPDKSLMSEILSPSYPDYFRLDNFLSEEEQELLHPDYDSGRTSINDYRHIDPSSLKQVFEKVFDYLKNHHDEFPLVHMVEERDRESLGGSSSDDFEYKGFKCLLDGYHNDYEHRHQLRLAQFNNGWETIDWIKADPTISLGSRTFYISTANKFECYKDILEELINICEDAIKAEKKLVWTFKN